MNEYRGSFIRPTNKICNGDDVKRNLVDEVYKILLDDSSTLSPNDDLYKAALNQYNQGVRASGTDRLPVPAGFCGFQDASTELWNIIAIGSTVDSGAAGTINELSNGPGYPPDQCLEFGVPGSIEYNFCKGATFQTPTVAEIPRLNPNPDHFIIALVIGGDSATSYVALDSSGEGFGGEFGESAAGGCLEFHAKYGNSIVRWSRTSYNLWASTLPFGSITLPFIGVSNPFRSKRYNYTLIRKIEEECSAFSIINTTWTHVDVAKIFAGWFAGGNNPKPEMAYSPVYASDGHVLSV